MSKVGVITSSAADIPPHLVQELDIHIIPCPVIVGDQTLLDGVEITSAELSDHLRQNPSRVTTASAPVGAFLDMYRQVAEQVDQIISVHLASTMSAMYNTATVARGMCPELDITLIDSTQVSMGLGWLAIAAARAAQAGQDAAEIEALVQDMIPRLRLFAYIEDLQYLQQSGRVSAVSALVGSILRIKPLISVQDGKADVIAKVRSRSKALTELVALGRQDGPVQACMVLHLGAPKVAERVRALMSPHLPDYDIEISEAGSTIGTHVGPGSVSINLVLAGS